MTKEDLVPQIIEVLGLKGERRLEDVLLLLLANQQGQDPSALSNLLNAALLMKLVGGKSKGIEGLLLATLLLNPAQQQSAATGSQPLLGNMLPLLLALGLFGDEEKREGGRPEVVEKKRA